MLRQLLSSVFTHITGTAFETALTGGAYSYEAPAGSALPYAVISPISVTPRYTFNTLQEAARVQVDIYAQSNAKAVDLFALLSALFDDCVLAVDGYTFVGMERSQVRPSKEGEGSHGVWRVSADYHVRFEKQL